MALEINKIYCGDNLELIKQLDDNCIDLTVTSPPYDNLRTYNGFSWDFEGLAKELFRVTKNGGVVVWVVGDATINGSETGTSFRQALYFMDCGFNLHDTMIYYRWSGPLTHNRYEQEFEYMFVLSKGKPRAFYPVMIKCEYFQKEADRTSQKIKKHSEINRKFRSENNRTNTKQYRQKGNVWKCLNTSHTNEKNGHPAPFPEKLAEDHIISWSNPGDLILDPFMGSGTTAKMALKNQRNFIGFELSQEYCDIAEKRIAQWREQERIDQWF
jgi:site-specific DNA-methyltransferase (adenine-specific)